jgi:N-acyl-L-homoserine lactone synthetase
VTDGSDSLARIDVVAAALVDRARPTTYRLATNPADIEVAQRLRGHAVLEQGWADEHELIDGRETDADDSRATHILATLDGSPIGTCRLIYPEKGRLLPMEQASDHVRVPQVAVEVGRIVVISPTTGTPPSVTAGLIASAWLELRVHGYQRICGTVSAPMLRLFRRLGFLVHVVGPQVHALGEVRYPILFEPDPQAAAAAATAVARHSIPRR